MNTIQKLQAFTRLIGYCTGYGGKYNPGRQTLQVKNLQAHSEAVRQALEVVKVTKVHFDNEVNARRQVYNQLPELAASVMRTMDASGASVEKLADARTFIRGIMGRSLTTRPVVKEGMATTEPIPVRRSQLQLSYASKADWFEKLVQSANTEPSYQPNEEELSIKGLTSKVEELRSLNQRVINARVNWSNARLQRDRLVEGKDSLIMLSRAVKKYLCAIFGFNSPEYAQVKGIIFH